MGDVGDIEKGVKLLLLDPSDISVQFNLESVSASRVKCIAIGPYYHDFGGTLAWMKHALGQLPFDFAVRPNLLSTHERKADASNQYRLAQWLTTPFQDGDFKLLVSMTKGKLTISGSICSAEFLTQLLKAAPDATFKELAIEGPLPEETKATTEIRTKARRRGRQAPPREIDIVEIKRLVGTLERMWGSGIADAMARGAARGMLRSMGAPAGVANDLRVRAGQYLDKEDVGNIAQVSRMHYQSIMDEVEKERAKKDGSHS